MNRELIAIFEYLEREKGIKREVVLAAIEDSLCVAARKSIAGAANVTVHINPKTADIEVYCEKEIVDVLEVPSLEITLEEARKIDPECELGQFIDVLITPEGFGRIAAQKARHIIAQKLRHAERDVIHEEYRHRIHEILTGVVKRIVRGHDIIVDLGKVEALLPRNQYPRTEKYQIGDRITALLLAVVETEGGGAQIILSRSDAEFARQVIMQEIPEIPDGTITIDAIVREAGYRTKFSVHSNDLKVDPVGACVGMRGARIKNVGRRLNNEKVDVFPHANDPVELLQNALAPAEIKKIRIDEDEKRMSIVVVDDDFAKAIGKRGLNARLTERLIGYQLEIKQLSDYNREVEMQRKALAFAEDPRLDQPLGILEGINPLILQPLEEIFASIGDFLRATPEELSQVPECSKEMAEDIREKIRELLA